jgi:hypothetical protein
MDSHYNLLFFCTQASLPALADSNSCAFQAHTTTLVYPFSIQCPFCLLHIFVHILPNNNLQKIKKPEHLRALSSRMLRLSEKLIDKFLKTPIKKRCPFRNFKKGTAIFKYIGLNPSQSHWYICICDFDIYGSVQIRVNIFLSIRKLFPL